MAKKRRVKRSRPKAKKIPSRGRRIGLAKTVARLAHRIETLRQDLAAIKKSMKLKKSRKKRR
jgi:hypothetical protein